MEACEAILAGGISAFIGLGGNFVRAVPERERIEAAWSKMRLTVQIATKLNRSHLVHGQVSYVLPCLGRIERDVQATGEQAVSMEDSTGCIHGSKGSARAGRPANCVRSHGSWPKSPRPCWRRIHWCRGTSGSPTTRGYGRRSP